MHDGSRSSYKNYPLAVFRNPSFTSTRMWLAQLISTIGDSFTIIASGILIFRLTGSALSVGLMLMATSIPTLMIGMIAGAFVDHVDRKKIMLVSDRAHTCVFCLEFGGT